MSEQAEQRAISAINIGVSNDISNPKFDPARNPVWRATPAAGRGSNTPNNATGITGLMKRMGVGELFAGVGNSFRKVPRE